MFKDFSRLSLAQRRLVFILIFGGFLALLLGITVLLASSALNANARQQSVALVETVSVRQFAALPDSDAYPASVVVAPDGTIYTGSYATGAIYRVDVDGNAAELPGTRTEIGAALGLAFAADGALLVVDQIDTDPRSSGGSLVRVPLNGDVIDTFFALPADGFVAPQDVAVDATGAIYISDSGLNQVYKFDADGRNGVVWWIPPSYLTAARLAVSGLVYDATTDTLLITEPEGGVIFRVALSDGTTTEVYRHGAGAEFPPGFNGITVTSDGAIYAAALGQNGIVLVQPPAADAPANPDGTPATATLAYIAGAFRGAADVAFDAPRNRLIVANFDQSSLVLPLVEPQLPFALDVIEFRSPDAPGT
ncbi:MAG: hypothetical protein SGI73_13305 [Chloroflexota bacterium]|nr:hypothetical protein [Chloroflexota bacterium]